jgi:hypothetical protein
MHGIHSMKRVSCDETLDDKDKKRSVFRFGTGTGNPPESRRHSGFSPIP